MQPVLTPVEMGEADRRTIAAGTPVDVLMERAGRAVAWRARRMLRGPYGRRVVVVCGRGNNGGDGLVAARVLRAWGVRTAVVELERAVEPDRLDRELARADLLVDAMYGTGFRGALEGDAAMVAGRSASLPALAVDIPSGVDGLTGEVRGPAVRAVATVTFQARKPGLLFEPGRALAGAVEVADLGIEPGAPLLGVPEAADVARWLPPRAPAAHKWTAGVLVVGGSRGMTGAALLASRAAMRAGAGIVWCAVPGADAAAAASGSEVITRALPATADGALDALGDALGPLERFRAVVVGPGLGTDARTARATRDLVARLDAPLVLDADGANAYAGAPGDLRSRAAPTVLTPHEGEYRRLVGEPVGPDRVVAARRLAAASGAVVLLKGPGTVVAEAGGRAVVNPTGGPELATAGSGDVLSGMIGAFLARGVPAFEAAAAAAFVHGRAADVAGHTGLVAGDLVRALPRALRDLGGPGDPGEPGRRCRPSSSTTLEA